MYGFYQGVVGGPNFQSDIRKHLLDYVIGDFEDKIKDADEFRPSVKDMHVADLNAGSRTFGRSGATNNAIHHVAGAKLLLNKEIC